MVAETHKIGDWSARQLEAEQALSAIPDDPARRPADRPPTRRPRPQSERRAAFWLGLLIGLVPLVAVVAGFVGYSMATDGSEDDGTQLATIDNESADPAPAEASEEPETDVTPSTDLGASVSPAEEDGDAADGTDGTDATGGTAQVDQVEPSARAQDGALWIEGTLPADAAAAYVEEFGLLADALGFDLVNATTVDEGAEVPSEIPTRFVDAVFFDRGSDQLDMEFLGLLDGISAYMMAGTADITIVSHTDASGSESANLHLSQHRAGQVFDYLTAMGVGSDRISVDPRGETDASGAMGEAAEAERRVEFVFSLDF